MERDDPFPVFNFYCVKQQGQGQGVVSDKEWDVMGMLPIRVSLPFPHDEPWSRAWMRCFGNGINIAHPWYHGPQIGTSSDEG